MNRRSPFSQAGSIPVVSSRDLRVLRADFDPWGQWIEDRRNRPPYGRAFSGELVYGIGATEARPSAEAAPLEARALQVRQQIARHLLAGLEPDIGDPLRQDRAEWSKAVEAGPDGRPRPGRPTATEVRAANTDVQWNAIRLSYACRSVMHETCQAYRVGGPNRACMCSCHVRTVGQLLGTVG